MAIFAVTKGADYFKPKATGSEDKGMESDELQERLAAIEAADDGGAGRDDRSQRKDRPHRGQALGRGVV